MLASPACREKIADYCDLETPCENPEKPFCDYEGEYPASGYHGRTCIPCPEGECVPDGGVGDAPAQEDAASADAAGADAIVPDARFVDGALGMDAGIDAGPVPPVTNGQPANLVLGQPDLTTTGSSETANAWNLRYPLGAATDGTHLWVGDSEHHRVVQWNGLPLVDQASADIAIGPPSLTTVAYGPTQARLGRIHTGPDQVHPNYVASDGTRVFVADSSNNRVLVFGPVPTASGANATTVLGQVDFTSNGSGTGASQLAGPRGMWTDGTVLIVADAANSRVLIWNALPVTYGDPADIVLGWPSFGMGSGDPIATPPTSSSMKNPTSVVYAGGRLYVADTGNHRVMVWVGLPTVNGVPADYFIGQGSGGTGNPNAGGASVNAAGLSSPTGILVAAGSLFISDRDNHRVVVHTPVPTTSGEPADVVLGQDSLTAGGLPAAPSANRLHSPESLAAVGDALFVVDYEWHRVARFQLSP